MPTIPNRFDFEPNKDALHLWLHTRKGEKHYGMSDAPGFFTTEGFGKDQFWFMLAIFLEIVGVSLLISNGLGLNDTVFAAIAVIGAIAMFAFDLFLAYKLHRNHGRKCYARNRAKVTDNSQEKNVILESLKKGRLVNILIVTGMILIAIIKLAGIVLMGQDFEHLAIIAFLVIMFGIIVYVHVYHTGYYLYEVLTARAFRKQFSKYNEQAVSMEKGEPQFQAKTRSVPYYGREDLLGFDKDKKPRQELQGNKHKITKLEGQEKEGKQAYELETEGILIDEDISTFLGQGGLDGEQQSIIARMCLDHQLKIYQGTI